MGLGPSKAFSVHLHVLPLTVYSGASRFNPMSPGPSVMTRSLQPPAETPLRHRHLAVRASIWDLGELTLSVHSKR